MAECHAQPAARETDREYIDQALGVLARLWGGDYMTGYDDKGWWAARRGQIGSFFRADGPVELGFAIEADTGAQPS